MTTTTTSQPRDKRPNGRGTYSYIASEDRWRAQFQDHNGRLRTLSAKTKEAVVRRLEESLVERDRGLLGQKPSQTPTLGDWLDRWLDMKDELAPSTRERYRLDINSHIKPQLGATRLDKVTVLSVEDLYRRHRASGLAAASVRHIHAVLRQAYREAYRVNVVGVNVMDRVRAPKAERTRVTYLSLMQASEVLSTAQTEGQMEYARWAIALRWGMRQGEVLGLRWSDIDLSTGRIEVRQALQRQTGAGLVFIKPKSRAGERTFIADRDTIEALLEWRHEQVERRLAAPEWSSPDLVFTTDRGTPIDPRNDYRRWRLLLGAAGLPRFRIHDCRHTAATYMLESGISERAVMEILGHSQISLTMNTYAHVTKKSLEDAALRVGSLYGS